MADINPSLTFVFVLRAIVELEVFLHQVCRSLFNVIGDQATDGWDFFYVPDRSQPSCCECLQNVYACKNMLLPRLFLLEYLCKLVNRKNRDVSIELLDRVVKDSAASFIYFIGIAASFVDANNFVLIIFLHLLLDVQDAGFAFCE